MQTNVLIEPVQFVLECLISNTPQNVDAQYVKIKAIACLRALLDVTLTYTVSYKACSHVVGVAARLMHCLLQHERDCISFTFT